MLISLKNHHVIIVVVNDVIDKMYNGTHMLLFKGCFKDAGFDSDFKSRDSSKVAFLLLPSVFGKLSSEFSLMKDSVFFSSSV